MGSDQSKGAKPRAGGVCGKVAKFCRRGRESASARKAPRLPPSLRLPDGLAGQRHSCKESRTKNRRATSKLSWHNA